MRVRFVLVPALDGVDQDHSDDLVNIGQYYDVNHIDLSSYIYNDWTVRQLTYGDIDSTTFRLRDERLQFTWEDFLQRELVVDLWSYDERTRRWIEPGRRLFAGRVTELEATTDGPVRVYQCRALGWAYQLGNLIINRNILESPIDPVTDRDLLTGRDDAGGRDAVVSLFDNVTSIVKPASTNIRVPVYWTDESVKVGTNNVGHRNFTHQPLRTVLDRLASEAPGGYIWRIEPDRRLVFRARDDIDGLATLDLSDEPEHSGHRKLRGPQSGVVLSLGNAVTRTVGDDQIATHRGQGRITETGHTFGGGTFQSDQATDILPQEMFAGELQDDANPITGIYVKLPEGEMDTDFNYWTIECRAYEFDMMPALKSDRSDYKALYVQFEHNADRWRFRMSDIIRDIRYVFNSNGDMTSQRIELQFPQGYDFNSADAIQGVWRLRFDLQGASFHSIKRLADASKVKNHIRVYGSAAPEIHRDFITTRPFLLYGYNYRLTRFSENSNETSPLRVHWVDDPAYNDALGPEVRQPLSELRIIYANAQETTDAGTFDGVWDHDRQQLKFQADGPRFSTLGIDLNVAQRFAVTGRYSQPVDGDAFAQDSIDLYGLRTLVIRDTSIESSEECDLRAQGELNEWETGHDVITLRTDFEDFEVARLATVRSAVLDLEGTQPRYVIETIEIRPESNSSDTRTYTMKLRNFNFRDLWTFDA